MFEVLPKLVKNYIIIRYEDLINDFQGTMESIKNKGLKQKDDIKRGINETKKWMKRDGHNTDTIKLKFVQPDPKKNLVPKIIAQNNKLLNLELKDVPKQYIYYEKILGYS